MRKIIVLIFTLAMLNIFSPAYADNQIPTINQKILETQQKLEALYQDLGKVKQQFKEIDNEILQMDFETNYPFGKSTFTSMKKSDVIEIALCASVLGAVLGMILLNLLHKCSSYR